MKQAIGMLLLLCLVFSACKQGEKKAEERASIVPLQDFFKDAKKQAYRISPDGERIIFRAPHMGRMNVFVQKLGDTTATPITHETERSLYDAFWESDDRIIFVKDVGGDENTHILSIKPDGSDLKDHIPFEKVRADVIDVLEDRPNEVLIQHNKRDAEIFDVYLLNLTTGKSKMVAQNPGNITSWITDHNGKIRAAVTTDGVNSSLLYRENESDKFKTVTTISFKETLSPVLFTFDNKNLYCLSNLGRDKTALVEFDPKTGKEVKLLYENPDVDVSGVDYSRKRKVLTYVSYETDKNERHFLDAEAEAIDKKIKQQIPQYAFCIASITKWWVILKKTVSCSQKSRRFFTLTKSECPYW
jgi:hypothetical protein